MSEKNKFIKYVAYLQIIGIILVVLGHSFHEYPDGNEGKTLLLYRMCYNFRMPLFMFVSGFLMVFTSFREKCKQKSVPYFVMNKVKRLMVPFLFITLITFVPRASLSFMADDDVSLSLHSLVRALFYDDALMIPYFWFLQASFALLTFTFAFISLFRHFKVKSWAYNALLIILFLILPEFDYPDYNFWAWYYILRLGIFFELGVLYGHYSEQINKHIRWSSIWLFICFVAIWGILFFISEEVEWVYQIASLFGICMCISLAHILEHYNVRILDHLIGSNYIIFLLSWYFNVASQQVLHHFVELPWQCYTLLSLALGIYMPWLLFKYMQRHANSKMVRGAAFLLGQNLKKRVLCTQN